MRLTGPGGQVVPLHPGRTWLELEPVGFSPWPGRAAAAQAYSRTTWPRASGGNGAGPPRAGSTLQLET
jgi:hypothetical protein